MSMPPASQSDQPNRPNRPNRPSQPYQSNQPDQPNQSSRPSRPNQTHQLPDQRPDKPSSHLPSHTLDERDRYIPVHGSAWRLALSDVNGDGVKELIYSTWDGRVCCQNLDDGKLIWEVAVGGFVFSLAAADVNSDGRTEVFAATAAGTLHAINGDGTTAWVYHAPGRLPLYNVAIGEFSADSGAGSPVAVGDTSHSAGDTSGDADGAAGNRRDDPNGAAENTAGDNPAIVCGGTDRGVHVLTPQGEHVTSTQVQQIVHRLAIGDLDGDGQDEILVIDGRVFAEVFRLEDGKLKSQWRKRLTVPEAMRNWENPRGNFFAFSVEIGDINQDGQNEIIMGDTYFNRQAVMALSGTGDTLWVTPPLKPRSNINEWYELYSTAFVRIAEPIDIDHRDHREHPEPEHLNSNDAEAAVLALAGGDLRLFNAKGEELKSARSSLGFTDLLLDGKTLFLGSTPNGDNTIYRIDLNGDWTKEVEELTRKGRAKEVGENLAHLKEQVLAYDGEVPQTNETYDWLTFELTPTDEGYAKVEKQMQEFRARFPYDHIRPVARVKVIEPTPPLNPEGEPWSPQRWQVDSINGTMSVEEIVRVAEEIERRKIPTLFRVGHSNMPFITLETAEKLLQAAPNYLVGFTTDEDESLERMESYFRHFFGPLADLCVKYGYKQCITKNKNVWWAAIPPIKSVFEEVFQGERRRVIVAATEDSNSRTPEINLMARAGLLQAGLIQNMQVSVHADLFSFCRFHQWEYPRSGHPYLRLLVAHTTMGGSNFRDSVVFPLVDGDSFTLNAMGSEYVETFLHMLGKGILTPPKPNEIAGTARVGIIMHEPPRKWLEDGLNGHNPWKWESDKELENAVIPHNGCQWGNSPTPSHALQHVLLHKQRQFGYNVPPTPYGPFLIVPSAADYEAIKGVDEWWHTDGIYLWQEGGPKLTGRKASLAIEAAFKRRRNQLPFLAVGDPVFLQTLSLGEDRYRIFAIDPGWLDPAPRRVTLQIQLEGVWELKDTLTGEPLSVDGGSAIVDVPAGAMRILDAVKR